MKEERRQRYENQPYGTLDDGGPAARVHPHPYQWPTIGYMEDLDAASEADYQAFYKKFLRPTTLRSWWLAISMRLRTRDLVQKYFGDIPRGRRWCSPPSEPPLGGEVRDIIHDRIQLPAVVMGYRIPANGTPDFYAVELLNRLLSNGNSARMNVALKDRQRGRPLWCVQLSLRAPGYRHALRHRE